MAIDREKVVQAALKFVEKKRFDKAIAEYQKILQEDPNDPRILLKVGDCQLKGEMYQAAIDTYERVGKHYASQGFSLKAIAVYKQIRDLIARHVPQLEERYGHILPKLAELYQQLGLTSDALSAYDEVASKLLKAGRDRDAIAVFEKIVGLDPSNPLPHLRLAEALARAKDVDGSIEQFSMASDILLKLGRRDDALKVVERLLQIRPDPDVARRAALLFLERAQPNDGMLALAKLQIAFQANPKDLDTLGLLARAFELIGQRPKAIEVQKETARLAREQGNKEVLRQLLDHLLKVAPDDEQVRMLVRAQNAGSAPSQPAPPPSASNVRDTSAVSLDSSEMSLEDIESIEDDAEAGGGEQPFALSRQSVPDEGPRSVHIPHSIRVAEELGPDDLGLDPVAFTAETLSDVEAFRSAQQHGRAIESLQIALEVVPGAVELREALRDVLLEVGDREGAVGEMITLAAISIEAGHGEHAAQALQEVLMLVPDHHRAREMLEGLGYGVLEPVEGETAAAPEATAAYDAQGSGYVDVDPDEPLPSYDLEEIGAGELLGRSDEHARAAAAFDDQDDPFEAAPLPTFALDDEPFGAERTVAFSAEPTVAAHGEHFSLDDEQRHDIDAEQEALSGTPMLATAARGFQGGDSIEDALEEVDFFASRGLHDDARAIVEEQLLRAPNHPLLLERLRELDATGDGAGASGAHPVGGERAGAAPQLTDEFDVGSSLDALDAFEPTQEAQQHFESDNEQVDVEAVFAKFKEGVKAQVEDGDSATHYDLGVAYKEMGLLKDSIGEFVMAARDPKRACVCHSMVGIIELERGNSDAAIEAFISALNAQDHTVDQELSLYYELGLIYVSKQNRDEALYYFRKIQRKDPQFRDVADHLRALEPPPPRAANGSAGAPSRSLNNEEDFDSVFDDIVGSGKLPLEPLRKRSVGPSPQRL